MKGKVTGVLLVILNLLLLGGLGFFYFQKDMEAPQMKAEEISLVYEEGMDETRLLEGVTAFDNEDGDITSQVVIEKVVTDSEKESATITYGVVDTAGNISKTTRTLDMLVEEEEVIEVSEEIAEETEPEENSEEASGEDEVAAEEEEESTAETAQAETNKKPAQENKKPVTGQENKKPAQNNQASAQTTKPTSQPANQNSNDKPSILFRDTTVKARVGGSPAWVNAIEGLYDDDDDYMTLFSTLKVYGDYDRNTPGTYKVKVSVTDSDGHESSAYPVEIVVE